MALLCAPILLSCSAKPVGYLKRQVERDGTRVLVRGIDPDTLIQRKYEFTTAGHQRQIEQLRQVQNQLTQQMKANKELAHQHNQHLATSIQNIHISRLNAKDKAMTYDDEVAHSLKASVRLDGVVHNELEFKMKVTDAGKFILASQQLRKDNMLYDLKLQCQNTSCRHIYGWLQQRQKHKPAQAYATSVFYYRISKPYVHMVRGRSNEEQRSRVFYDVEQAQAKNNLKVERKVWQVIGGVSATEVQLLHPTKKDNIFRLQADVVDTHDHAIEAQIKISPTYFKGLDVKAQLAHLRDSTGDMLFILSVYQGEESKAEEGAAAKTKDDKAARVGAKGSSRKNVLMQAPGFRGPVRTLEKGALIEDISFNVSRLRIRQRPQHEFDRRTLRQQKDQDADPSSSEPNKKIESTPNNNEVSDASPRPDTSSPVRGREDSDRPEAEGGTGAGTDTATGHRVGSDPSKPEARQQSIFSLNIDPSTHPESYAALQDFEFLEGENEIQKAVHRLLSTAEKKRGRTKRYLKHLPYVAPLLQGIFQSEDVFISMAHLLYRESNCVSGGFKASADMPDDRYECRARNNKSSAGGAFQIINGTVQDANQKKLGGVLATCQNPHKRCMVWDEATRQYNKDEITDTPCGCSTKEIKDKTCKNVYVWPRESQRAAWCLCHGRAPGSCDARYHFDSNAFLAALVLRRKIEALKEMYSKKGWKNFDYALAVAAYYVGEGKAEELLVQGRMEQQESNLLRDQFPASLQILLQYGLLGKKHNDISERIAMHFIAKQPLKYFASDEICPFTSAAEKQKIEARVQKLLIPKSDMPLQNQCPTKKAALCEHAQCRLCRLQSIPAKYSVSKADLLRHLPKGSCN